MLWNESFMESWKCRLEGTKIYDPSMELAAVELANLEEGEKFLQGVSQSE